jgi:hypothetical protein
MAVVPEDSAIAAVLAGSRGYSAIAERAARLTQKQLKRLRARYHPRTERVAPPSEPTVRRILQGADVGRVDASLSDWLPGLGEDGDAVAGDGKTLRGAVREDATRVHLLSAFLQDQDVTVAQREIPAKTHEIPEIKPLLEPLDLRARVVTADALPTQRETVRFLLEDKQAHYLLTVKENQPTRYADLQALSEAHVPPARSDPR